MKAQFAHLRVHTEYSLVDGLLRVDEYVENLARLGMQAAAVTELHNMFSMVKFYRACLRHGVKPVIGAELSLRGGDDGGKSSRLVLLCQDQVGFRNLTALVTRSFTEGQTRDGPMIAREWLQAHAQGLIALSGARAGAVGQALLDDNQALARRQLDWFLSLFPERFYLELQRTGRQGEDHYLEGALALAAEFDAPVAATNEVQFLRPEDFETHEARVCIQTGHVLNDSRRPRLYSQEQYLKTPEQMAELFREAPEAVENAGLIAQRCNLPLRFDETHLPEFPVPEGHDQASWLRNQAEQGLEAKLRDKALAGVQTEQAPYQERLERELEVIITMGFPGYFLIVADFIHWAREQDIPVGPGRGSGAGSLAAWALGITDLDPIAHELLFERFLNPERVSLPDFDVDFCMDRRDEVIEYVAERYGSDRVSQIVTFGSMAAKAVVRDVGRVLGHPYGYVDQIAKQIPFAIDMTLEKALAESPELKQRYAGEEEVRILIDLAKKLEGLVRNAGKHAGGIVIAPRPLTEFMPLYCERGAPVTSTQFDMGDVEDMGLVKFDFLGLRTLTIIDWAVKDVNRRLADSDAALDMNTLSLDEAAPYDLIRRMDTTGVFQLESEGVRKLIKRLEPDKFDELVALLALYRPGPLEAGMVSDFVDRKHGRAEVTYLRPELKPVLQPTYGVILYQEQVMQIAQLLGGYTLGAADLLRRAMGKKKPEEMAQQRDIFVDGAIKNRVPARDAAIIFGLMEKFAGYGFNKSHSAAYALLAYQTAWLKARHPAAFMAAVLSADMQSADRIVSLRQELKRMNLALRPPSLNQSDYKFKMVDEKTIRHGLGAIKGVGKSAVMSICQERERKGPYSDLFSFCRRVDRSRVNKGVMEPLIRAGVLDDFGQSRSVLMASVEQAIRFADQCAHNEDTGQDDLFGLTATAAAGAGSGAGGEKALPYIMADEWDFHERLRGEKNTLGFYLQGHPIEDCERELERLVSRRLDQVKPEDGRLTVAGYVESLRARAAPKGRMGEFWLDDSAGRMPVTAYPETWNRCRDLVRKDELVIVRGEAVADDYHQAGVAVVAREVYTLPQVRERYGALRLSLRDSMVDQGFVAGLKDLFSRHGGGSNPVSLEYHNSQACATLNLDSGWKVKLNAALLADLQAVMGADNVALAFPEWRPG